MPRYGRTRARGGVAQGGIQMLASLTGPLWEKDVRQSVGLNIRALLEDLAAEGEGMVKGSIDSDKMRPYIVGRVESLRGAPWWLNAVVSAFPNAEDAKRVYPWGVRGGRSFGIAASGTYTRGARKGQTWTKSDTEMHERYANAVYRGGKQERRTRAFRNATGRLKTMGILYRADITKGLG